jgi:glutamate--cysteine ligase
MLDEMRDRGEGFYQFARRLSQQHHRFFVERELSDATVATLDAMAIESLAEQARMEAEPQTDFQRFLADYFEQTG